LRSPSASPAEARSAKAFRWLLRKEWRELTRARAWWAMLALVGPLVGVSFINAVRTYGEASAGAATGGGEAFSPLDGVWSPTFSAYELIAIFLLPFVAIRLMTADRQSGALKLELQRPISPFARVGAKAIVLLGGWIAAGAAAIAAGVLWASYGGHTYAPELAAVVLGHLLNAALTIGLAAAAATVTEHPSTAAIATLGVTIGTWAVSFIAAVQGGVWETIAGYTPMAMVSMFQHGLVRADVVLIALALAATGFGVAGIWIEIGKSIQTRLVRTAALAGTAALAVTIASFVRPSWDLSENRRNSFSESDEAALRHLPGRLQMEVHLAQRDPRRFDLEVHALAKLRRVRPDVEVTYIARTSIGLFEQADPGYGEIRYNMNGRQAVSRVTTAEGVLETIYDLAGVTVPADNEAPYKGYPLTARPTGAPLIFYVLWPVLTAALGIAINRRTR